MLCKSGCHRLVLRCMIIHSVHNNNPRSLSCTADLSSPQAHSAPLYRLFSVKSWIIRASAVTATHTHTICYKMALDLHPILNLHLGYSYRLHSNFANGLVHYSTSRASSVLLMATALPYNIDHRLSKCSA